MRDYTGPTPSDPTPRPHSPSSTRKWVELDEEPPCEICGELLISQVTVQHAKAKDWTFMGKKLCRNEH